MKDRFPDLVREQVGTTPFLHSFAPYLNRDLGYVMETELSDASGMKASYRQFSNFTSQCPPVLGFGIAIEFE